MRVQKRAGDENWSSRIGFSCVRPDGLKAAAAATTTTAEICSKAQTGSIRQPAKAERVDGREKQQERSGERERERRYKSNMERHG